MRFQNRDKKILWEIFDNDGVMAKRQIKERYWPGKSWRAMERRLSILRRASYLDWPSQEHRRTKPIPEPICWLGFMGALIIASECGVVVKSPTGDNENQLRLLQVALRKYGINWVREPRWSLLEHDIATVDFRVAVTRALDEVPSLTLETWIQESKFRSNMDVVVFRTKSKNRKAKQMKKGVCPDGYFEIVDETRKLKGEQYKAKFLLEVDMATHDNPSFGREKVAPGVAYIQSNAYKARFGNNKGRWLVVTSGGAIRMRNLMRQTRENAGPNAHWFYFTFLDQLGQGNVLTSPIWLQVGRSKPKPLLII